MKYVHSLESNGVGTLVIVTRETGAEPGMVKNSGAINITARVFTGGEYAKRVTYALEKAEVVYNLYPVGEDRTNWNRIYDTMLDTDIGFVVEINSRKCLLRPLEEEVMWAFNIDNSIQKQNG